MDEYEVIKAHVPESVQALIHSGNSTKVAQIVTGLNDFSLYKIAERVGQDMAQYRMRWRPVVDGLLALNELRRG